MAATPFKGNMTIRYDDGDVDVQPFSASDVANAVVTWGNTGLSFYQTKNKFGYIVDITLTAAGVDTTQLNVKVNSRDTGIAWLDAGVVATVNNRIPSPPRIGPGIQMQLKQLA